MVNKILGVLKILPHTLTPKTLRDPSKDRSVVVARRGP